MLKKCLNVESKPDNAQSRVFFPCKIKILNVCLFIWVFCFVFLFCSAENGNQDFDYAR